jgi:hypothetical protein
MLVTWAPRPVVSISPILAGKELTGKLCPSLSGSFSGWPSLMVTVSTRGLNGMLFSEGWPNTLIASARASWDRWYSGKDIAARPRLCETELGLPRSPVFVRRSVPDAKFLGRYNGTENVLLDVRWQKRKQCEGFVVPSDAGRGRVQFRVPVRSDVILGFYGLGCLLEDCCHVGVFGNCEFHGVSVLVVSKVPTTLVVNEIKTYLIQAIIQGKR